MPQWDSEIAVDRAPARRLLGEQFPDLAPLPVRLLGSGWDNTVYAVGDEWVSGFPRREVVVRGIETEIAALIEDALDLPPPEPTAVCHGDLHFRHVLVDGDRVSGLIDWIDLCCGDPALDLQLVWSVLPPECGGAFFGLYGEVDDATLLRARAVALFLSAALFEYAHHEGLQAVEREAPASLERVART